MAGNPQKRELGARLYWANGLRMKSRNMARIYLSSEEPNLAAARIDLTMFRNQHHMLNNVGDFHKREHMWLEEELNVSIH